MISQKCFFTTKNKKKNSFSYNCVNSEHLSEFNINLLSSIKPKKTTTYFKPNTNVLNNTLVSLYTEVYPEHNDPGLCYRCVRCHVCK